MRRSVVTLVASLAAAIAAPCPAVALEMALVLLNDVSNSMDDAEYAMVKDGYRAAFSDPEVVAAIGANSGGVAVAYVEFSGKHEVILVKGWDVLTDADSARAFGDAVARAPRTSAGDTAMAAGVAKAAQLLLAGGFGGARLVIDIASDHPYDGGRTAGVRDRAVAAGITINALPIVDDRIIGTFDGRMTYSTVQWGAATMTEFYISDVIGGGGRFAIEARSYEVFGEALKRKLLRELIASPGGGGPDRGLVVATLSATE